MSYLDRCVTCRTFRGAHEDIKHEFVYKALTQPNLFARVKLLGKGPGEKETTMSDLTAIALGTPVEYRDSEGRRKAALIIGTPETIDDNSMLEVPEEGHADLVVFSPTGSRYVSRNIAEGEGPHTFTVR